MITQSRPPSRRGLFYVDDVFQPEPRSVKCGEALRDLLRHCSLYVSDRAIADDFTTVVIPLARSEADAKALRRYRRARRLAPGFAPGSDESNSHRRIPPAVLAQITAPAVPATLVRRSGRCDVCGGAFKASRVDHLTCSAKCRQRKRRQVIKGTSVRLGVTALTPA